MDDDAPFLLDAERKAKQSFLREEVVEAGYPPDAFVAFCEQQRGADVDLWPFNELHQCVAEFKRSYKPEKIPSTDRIEPVLKPQKTVAEPIAKGLEEGKQRSSSIEVTRQAVDSSKVDLLYTIKGTITPETELSSALNLKIVVSA